MQREMQEGIGLAVLRCPFMRAIAGAIIEDGVVFGVTQHDIECGGLQSFQRRLPAVFGPQVEKEIAHFVAAGIEHFWSEGVKE